LNVSNTQLPKQSPKCQPRIGKSPDSAHCSTFEALKLKATFGSRHALVKGK